MKYKALFFATVSFSTFAAPISLIKRQDASPPYIVEQYNCDIPKMTHGVGGSSFGPVQDFPAGTYLAVTSEVYESLALQGVQKWLAYMDSDKEVASMRAKVRQFENSGNIAAMKHWDQKLLNEGQAKQGVIMKNVFGSYIAKVSSEESTKTYHEPQFGNSKKYGSFSEMKEDFRSYCNMKSTFN